MYKYLLINSQTLLAKQFISGLKSPATEVWELSFTDDYVTTSKNNKHSFSSICDPKDDWSLNYELERAFLEFGSFDEVILFPGDLKFGAIEAIPSRIIDEQVSRQIVSVMQIYRILADRLRSQKSCCVTQFLYEESYEFSALSSLPMAVNGALRGLVNGLRKEFSEINVDIGFKTLKPIYKDFINDEYSFLNDLKLAHYQPLVNRHLEGVDKLFVGRERIMNR